MGAGIFVTGTDTGVGKTAISCGILASLRKRGLLLGALKPAESGHQASAETWPPDAKALAAAAGLRGSRDTVVPYVFAEALAPMVAAKRAGVTIDIDRLDAAFERQRDTHDLTVVEGAGGLAVPLTEETNMAQLARRWGLPILIVARAGLGTLNHTALTVAFARQNHLRVLGVILNGASPAPDVAEKTNPEILESLTGVPLLGIVPRQPGVDVDQGLVAPMQAAVERHVDLAPILELAGALA